MIAHKSMHSLFIGAALYFISTAIHAQGGSTLC